MTEPSTLTNVIGVLSWGAILAAAGWGALGIRRLWRKKR